MDALEAIGAEPEARRLVLLGQARLALEQAQAIDEVMEWRDRASAMESYLRRRDDAEESQRHAAELKLRAERRIGQLAPAPSTNRHDSLASQGWTLGRRETHLCRLLAALPDADFDCELAEGHGKKEITRARMLTAAKSYISKREHGERVAAPDRNEGPRCYPSFDALLAALGDGREKPFGAVYADPPWSYANKGTRGTADDEYTTAGQGAIEAMPVERLAAEDAFLFMWATSPLLPEGLAVLRAWGFTYKASMVWDKDRMGLGNYARVQHELLLIGVRGKPKWTRRDVRSVFRGEAGEHSVKPEAFAQLVESTCAGPYAELFARRWRPSWACMGNEIDGRAPKPEEDLGMFSSAAAADDAAKGVA